MADATLGLGVTSSSPKSGYLKKRKKNRSGVHFTPFRSRLWIRSFPLLAPRTVGAPDAPAGESGAARTRHAEARVGRSIVRPTVDAAPRKVAETGSPGRGGANAGRGAVPTMDGTGPGTRTHPARAQGASTAWRSLRFLLTAPADVHPTGSAGWGGPLHQPPRATWPRRAPGRLPCHTPWLWKKGRCAYWEVQICAARRFSTCSRRGHRGPAKRHGPGSQGEEGAWPGPGPRRRPGSSAVSVQTSRNSYLTGNSCGDYSSSRDEGRRKGR